MKIPLAQKMRPTKLCDFVGQEHITKSGSYLANMLATKNLSSTIFWGPSGVGKTTLVNILANSLDSHFVSLSAVNSGIKEIKEVVEIASNHQNLFKKPTILFLDEIHRFNKSQQDSLLPHVESGIITLFGATTENPSIEINRALLSRVQVIILKALNEQDIITILDKALKIENFDTPIDADVIQNIAQSANGDARCALNILEALMNSAIGTQTEKITIEHLKHLNIKKVLAIGKKSDSHYNLTSALIKSVRHSDVQAALYWLARLLESGEDPLFVARRMLCLASEDIGLAAPNALEQAVAAYQSVSYLGMPEAYLPLSQIVIYLSLAPKSNSAMMAYNRAKDLALKTDHLEVPLNLRNAVNQFLKELNYAKDYVYAHNYQDSQDKPAMRCLPEEIDSTIKFYIPGNKGFESKF